MVDWKHFSIFQVREWELQFSEKYDLVGKLIKPGEEPTFYSDASSDEEEEEVKAAEDKKAQWILKNSLNHYVIIRIPVNFPEFSHSVKKHTAIAESPASGLVGPYPEKIHLIWSKLKHVGIHGILKKY